MLPPPAISRRRVGRLSSRRNSLITVVMLRASARKKTSSSSWMTVVPSGLMARRLRKMAATRASTLAGRCCRSSRISWPTRAPSRTARTPTSCARPLAKSSTCRAPGYSISRSICRQTRSSGLIAALTASAMPMYSDSRKRATRVAVLNRRWATWQAIRLTSSLDVTATSRLASSAPACAITLGNEAWPTTVRMSSFSASSRSFWWSVSTTVMSLFSPASDAATDEPTCPAPRIRIFMITLIGE